MVLSPEQLNFYEENGYLVVKKLFSTEEVNKIIKECFQVWVEMLRTSEMSQFDSLENIFPTITGIHKRNESLTKYMLDPRVIDILEAIAGEEVLAFLQNYYFKAPGGKSIPIHQDNWETCAYPGTTYAAWISLDQSDSKNGGLFFVPKTQNSSILEDQSNLIIQEGLQAIDLTTGPGDVVFFNGNIYHGSHSNTSNRFRRTFLTHYVGKSVEKIAINHHSLIDKHGNKIRRKYNLSPRYHN
ncbi:phytanoyl-CoA dioxygenase family protein [Bacillus sp. 166amftsu]|uniref:phytanoyl-CoA dioxygenase family protein n=1 Tax=Bacillus sp. 166amftsu TaxID=1761753 RepID=UPI00089C2B4C|nr:phytanoyl-CoA dioxygenase family protein [Bacillus sp. 166amftsu]SDZ37854.1 Ectoine hydroxylase-related dioxygenase, phytanoyl-CoA dioxygenase (PhyH) family [Bacillus sp. 166amftsu]